jgi:hypothetical protein
LPLFRLNRSTLKNNIEKKVSQRHNLARTFIKTSLFTHLAACWFLSAVTVPKIGGTTTYTLNGATVLEDGKPVAFDGSGRDDPSIGGPVD